ncbi:hypothetical protein Tco_1149363 [Tanacetum coccineum]
MPPPPIPSTLNTMPPPPTPSGSNTMPPYPTPYCSNIMPPPPTPSGSNTMPSHATSASIGTNKGNGPLIRKKEAGLPKVVLLAAELVLGMVQPAEVVLGVVLGEVQAKEVEVQAK